MTPENKQKKDYLSRYMWYVVKLDEIDQEISKCRMNALPGSPAYDGMPHGSGSDADLSNYAAELDRLILEFKENREKCIKALREISAAIEAVKEPKYNILLRYKYIQLKSWRETADAMGYVPEYVRRELHSKALEAFEIPYD